MNSPDLSTPPTSSSLSLCLHQALMFQDLSVEQLAILETMAIAQSYPKGDILFHEGDDGKGFFVIQSGRIKVFKLSADGKEQILHVFCPGEHFAEVAVLDGHCFPASAAAIEPSEVLFFPRQPFLELLEQQPTLTINLLKSFARHLRQLSHLVDNLALRDVPARLATYLLQLPPVCHVTPHDDDESVDDHDSSSYGFNANLEPIRVVELDLPKGQLAAQLGTIPETLSRVFAKLGRDGLLNIDGKTIQLLDVQQLHLIATGRKPE